MADLADWLAADDFYRPAHAAIYRTITGLWTSMQRGDPRTVLDHHTVLDYRTVLDSRSRWPAVSSMTCPCRATAPVRCARHTCTP